MATAFSGLTLSAIGADAGTIIGWVAGILVIPVAFTWGRKLINFVVGKLRSA